MNIFDLAQQKVNLKKVSTTNGGEWQGPCPWCGGTDRFHVWPEKGTYWCRGCEKSGDAIQFLRDFEGKTFREACDYLNITMEQRPSEPKPRTQKPQFTPATHQSPAQIWQHRAETFIAWAHANLKQNPDVMKWLAERGISAAAVDHHRLGWNPGENGKDIYRPRKTWGLPDEIKQDTGRPKKLWIPIGLVIPDITDNIIIRIRVRRPEGEPRYYVIPGSSMSIMIIGVDRKAFVIVESELDGIACAAATELCGAMAMGSSHTKPDAAAYELLKNTTHILNALDYDKAGATAMQWWDEQYGEKCDRWPVPQGKDPGEAYRLGTDLSAWIRAGLPPSITLGENNKKIVIPTRGTIAAEAGIQSADVISSEVRNLKEINPLIAELYQLLKNNPAVKIINKPERFTVLRNDRYVGGRINDLVFKEPDVREYILNHPDEEITWKNLLIVNGE